MRRYLGMTNLPEDEERRLLDVDINELLRVWNTSGRGNKIIGVSDKYQLIQRIASVPHLSQHVQSIPIMENDQVKPSEIASASTAELVAEYNKITGKNIAKFKNRATAEEKVASVLPKQRGRKPINATYKYVGTDEVRVRDTSMRGQVLAAIKEAGKIQKADLDRKFGQNTSGFVSKLVLSGHIQQLA